MVSSGQWLVLIIAPREDVLLTWAKASLRGILGAAALYWPPGLKQWGANGSFERLRIQAWIEWFDSVAKYDEEDYMRVFKNAFDGFSEPIPCVKGSVKCLR